MDTTKLRELVDEVDALHVTAPGRSAKIVAALREVERLLAGAQDASLPAARYPAHRQPKARQSRKAATERWERTP